MKTSGELANRFREVFLNGTWIANTNYQKQLKDITQHEACTKVSSLNTMALLTFHINYYVAGVLQVFEGGTLDIRDKFSFDMPEISSEKNWTDLLSDLLGNAEKFATHVEHMSESQLEEYFVEKKYGTYRRNIEGMIEHAYYHLGQISLIKKMVREY